MRHLIDRLEKERRLEKEEWTALISAGADREYLFERADLARKKYYGRKVFTRGLIEFTNYCKNNCYYCGIRCGNPNVKRYRLSQEEILDCCENGYGLGFRTFVLQGGEDPFYTDERMAEIVREIKRRGHKIFLDLKLHDIPNTVMKAMRVLSGLDVDGVMIEDEADFRRFLRGKFIRYPIAGRGSGVYELADACHPGAFCYIVCPQNV